MHEIYDAVTTHMGTVYTFCIQKLNIKDVYNWCIQNVYKMYTIFWQLLYAFCIQNVYKSLSKCGIHFVYKHFIYILYTKVCQNMGYICIQTFCIHFVYKRIQNVYENL